MVWHWLFDNPLGGMYGPYFLIFYAAYIAAVFWIARGAVLRVGVPAFAPDALPARPDPYAIAWMRGGEPAMMELAQFRLIHDGLIKFGSEPPHKVTYKANYLDAAIGELHRVERRALDRIKTGQILPRNAHEALSDDYTQDFVREMQRDGLVLDDATRERLSRITRNAVLCVFGMGAYKLIAAIATGHHNVVFLIVMAAIGALWTAANLVPATIAKGRLTPKGEDFLKRLRSSLRTQHRARDLSLDDWLLLGAVAGVGWLTAQHFAAYEALFAQQVVAARHADSTYVGGSDTLSDTGSSDSGGGGGCGGGCGGCGGGGD